MNAAMEGLLSRNQSRALAWGVIGQGYVGLPLALVFREAGFPVIGPDIDPRKVEALRRGDSYICWKAAEHGAWTQLIELAGEINTSTPRHVGRNVAHVLNEEAEVLEGSKVLAPGLARKANIDDDREPPSYEILELLREAGALADCCDPLFPAARKGRKYDLGLRSVLCGGPRRLRRGRPGDGPRRVQGPVAVPRRWPGRRHPQRDRSDVGRRGEGASSTGEGVSEPRRRCRGLASGGGATIVHVMTAPVSLVFLAGQVSFMRNAGYSVHAITSPGPELVSFGAREGVSVLAVDMPRRITPLQDVVALWGLWRALRRIRPDIVHAHTPKGGLLGMLAAWLARVPVRVYHMRGLPFVTAAGSRRRLLRATERFSCALAHRVLAVSHSIRTIAVDERLCEKDKIKVLLGGSGNGVDATGRFVPQAPAVRAEAREALAIPADALVIGFVGRLVRDKGVVELATAWRRLRERISGLHLLLVGPPESEDAVPGEVLAALRADPRVRLTGHARDMPRLYAAMDVVALPTYREGFPNVALEAAAMEIPIVATSVPGCVDAVQHGITGLLVPPRDAAALGDALGRYLEDPTLRKLHGVTARRRVLVEFRREGIWQAVVDEYRSLLARSGSRSGSEASHA